MSHDWNEQKETRQDNLDKWRTHILSSSDIHSNPPAKTAKLGPAHFHRLLPKKTPSSTLSLSLISIRKFLDRSIDLSVQWYFILFLSCSFCALSFNPKLRKVSMMGKENLSQSINGGLNNEGQLPTKSQDSENHSRCSLDKEAGVTTCRVCQCAESDRRGDAALGFLGIVPPLQEAHKSNASVKPESKEVPVDVVTVDFPNKNAGRESGLVEFISPEGEVFLCHADLELGLCNQQDSLIELGCSCKSDLALVHYACALKWFVNHGSTICEICGLVATNIRTSDFKKVMVALKDYEALRERTAIGDPNPAQVHTSAGVDPDAVAAIRRQRLSEISLWFTPHNNNNNNNNYNNSSAVSQVVSEQPLNTVTEGVNPAENPATKWAVEGTGILLATGLLTITLAWLIAPRVGKKTARSGLHILLGGICALTVVIFFRFIVLTRIKYGPARYWAILFVFWFLVFGIWASRTHGAHTT